jgi:hypothetical protein
MLRSTSIVSKHYLATDFVFSTSEHDYSIGMDSFKKGLTMQMVLLESLNARSFLVIRSCSNSLSQTRQEHFGTIHIMVGFKFNLLDLN